MLLGSAVKFSFTTFFARNKRGARSFANSKNKTERERARPVSERIKEIFRQHGVTVTAVFEAVGATIGTMLSVIANVFEPPEQKQ